MKLTLEQAGLLLDAIKPYKKVQHDKALQMRLDGFKSSERRHNRHCNIIEEIEEKIKEDCREIRAEKFEKHRTSLKYLRGVKGNDRLIK